MIGFASREHLTAKAKFSCLLQALRQRCRDRYDVSLSIPPTRQGSKASRKPALDVSQPAPHKLTQDEAAARWAYGSSILVLKISLREWRKIVARKRTLAVLHVRLMERLQLSTLTQTLTAWRRVAVEMRKVSTWSDDSDEDDDDENGLFQDAASERTPASVFEAAHSPNSGPYHLSARAKVQREQAAVLRQIQAAMHSKRTVHGHSIADTQSIFRYRCF